MTLRLPVLMYHGLHRDHASHGVFEPTYSVAPVDFVRQLDWLAERGVTTRRLGDHPPSSGPSVVLTFDDGDVSTVEVALPLLAERDMVAEFFVTTDFIGCPGMVSPSQVAELAAAGMGVQSHGRTHRHLAGLDPVDLREELETSRSVLEELTGSRVDAVSLPGGRGGRREIAGARACGYRWVLNSVPGPNRRATRQPVLHRIPVTRGLPLEDFGDLVRWRGWPSLRLAGRTTALELPKQVLGDARYGRVRAALRARRCR